MHCVGVYLRWRGKFRKALGVRPQVIFIPAHLLNEGLMDRAPEQDVCRHHRICGGLEGGG